jgi:hypothetical protein
MDPHVPPRVEIPARPAEATAPTTPTMPAEAGANEQLIGPKLMQKRPAIGDRYEVAGPTRLPPAPQASARPQSPGPTATTATSPMGRVPVGTSVEASARAAAMPPLPEHVSTLPQETLPEAEPVAPKARTASGAARYPASRY